MKVLHPAIPDVPIPAPNREGGLPLREALSKRHSAREFVRKELPLPVLSNLLWAAFGVNRSDGHRTAPSALNAQEIDVYVALPSGAYLYDAIANSLQLAARSDLRRLTVNRRDPAALLESIKSDTCPADRRRDRR